MRGGLGHGLVEVVVYGVEGVDAELLHGVAGGDDAEGAGVGDVAAVARVYADLEYEVCFRVGLHVGLGAVGLEAADASYGSIAQVRAAHRQAQGERGG